MSKKRPIIIENAIRYSLVDDPFSCEVSKRPFPYRKGEIGLIDTEIVDFYSNLKENLRTCKPSRKSIFNLAGFPSPHQVVHRTEWGLGSIFYHSSPEKIPIIVYEESFPRGLRTLSYLLINLREGEFRDLTHDEEKENSKLIQALNTWEYHHNGVQDLAMENARVDISEEEISAKKNLLESFKRFDKNRSLSLEHGKKIIVN